MDYEKYKATVRSNFQTNDYESVADADGFDLLASKTIMASQLDTGVERRYLSLDWHDTVTLDTVTDTVDSIRSVAQEQQRVGDLTAGKTGLTTTPVFAGIVTDSLEDGDVGEAATKRDFVNGTNITVPVVVELDSGGLRGGMDVSHPLPKRRQLPKRRAVKKVVGAIYKS